jgi:membrane dipeptidase
MKNRTPIFDLHLDLEVYFNKSLRDFLKFKYLPFNKLYTKRHVDLVQARKVSLRYAIVQIQSIYITKNKKISPLTDFKKAIYNLEQFKKIAKKFFKVITDTKDFENLRSNEIGILLGFEGLNFVSNIKDLEILWKNGVRVFGLCWNFENKICGGLWSKKGLTSFGRDSLVFLNKLNAVVDLAHANESTILEAMKISKNFIFSHNNISEISNFEQNISKKVLDDLKGKRSLIGLTLLPKALKPKISFETFLKNYRYLYEKNENLLAIGTDYFGFDFESSPEGAKNYIEFRNNLEKNKVNLSKIFKNTYKFFYNIIKRW